MGALERLKELWRHTGFRLLFNNADWQRMNLPAYVKRAPADFQILTPAGMLTGKKDDYIVRWPDGDHAVISAATHAAIEKLLSAPAASEHQAQEKTNG